MAFAAANLRHVDGPPGRAIYRYDTTDALTAVEVPGYIDNEDDNQNIAKGDIFHVVVWSTAVFTGLPTDYGIHVVVDVASGAVNLSTDQLGGTFTSTA